MPMREMSAATPASNVACEIADGIATFRLHGQQSLMQARRWATAAIVQAVEQRFARVLLDISHVEGFEPPSLATRQEMARELAEIVAHGMKIAMIARPEFIDREKFGVASAANFGMTTNVFTTEPPAVAWLLEPA